MRNWLAKAVALTLLLLLGWFVARSHEPTYNQPAGQSADDRTPAVGSASDAFIWVAFSGGGTRAAAMAWTVLEVLSTIPFTYDVNGTQVNSNLADEIDYISGISGGCFAAAAWPLFREHPEAFRARFLERNIEHQLLSDLVWPPRLFWLLSPKYDRINVAAEYYDREIFEGKTFSDLPARPALRIHATDLALGARFTFAEDEFSQIGSSLADYPLGYACAASSAFPVLLSPLTLRNYGRTKSIQELEAGDRLYRRHVRNARNDVLADLLRIGREHYNDKSNRYVHLADGGIVDNQGLQAILDEFETGGVINRRLGDKENPLRRLILINVNAGVTPEDLSAKDPHAPGVNAVMKHTMVASMDILSARRWMNIKEFSQQLYKPVIDARVGGPVVPGLRKLEQPYNIEVSFRNVREPELRRRASNLPTSFALDESQLALIEHIVPQLIADDPDMMRLRSSVEADF